eukprot:TRINITY_DN5298_c0_g2_i1.p1 TRINITY_DN5298_c0_g2~~TRINITY_DN5298_c0_g2_i1.p1  ORF type:complete len:667 (+),score=153.06 TRINITY_DN5298_c0_g2_i1:284-2002(+)
MAAPYGGMEGGSGGGGFVLGQGLPPPAAAGAGAAGPGGFGGGGAGAGTLGGGAAGGLAAGGLAAGGLAAGAGAAAAAGAAGSSDFPSSTSAGKQSSAASSAMDAPTGSGSPVVSGGGPSQGTWFAYAEVMAATNNFAPENKLGEGGFGQVFRGVLPDGRAIAVKMLTVGGGQGEREFRAEVETISRVHHKHLVTLLGYSISNDQRLLLYEYVPNGTLEEALHKGRKGVMPWTVRLRVAVGAARGLAYLHEDCQPRIFHRDIKSSNILLDSQYEAKVADFGLARLASDTFTHITTRVMGTFGYLAPEYAMSGKLTEKSDVFSFGVVLLELLTGRLPVDTSRPSGHESLVEWARPLLAREQFDILADERMQGQFPQEEFQRLASVAGLCVRHSADKRPTIGKVVRLLEGSSYAAEMDASGNRPGMSSQYDPSTPFGGAETFDSEEYSQLMGPLMRPPVEAAPVHSDTFSNPSGSHMRPPDFDVESDDNPSGEFLYSGPMSGSQSGHQHDPHTAANRPLPSLSESDTLGAGAGWAAGSSGKTPVDRKSPAAVPQFSGELDYGHGQMYSDRLQEGR